MTTVVSFHTDRVDIAIYQKTMFNSERGKFVTRWKNPAGDTVRFNI